MRCARPARAPARARGGASSRPATRPTGVANLGRRGGADRGAPGPSLQALTTTATAGVHVAGLGRARHVMGRRAERGGGARPSWRSGRRRRGEGASSSSATRPTCARPSRRSGRGRTSCARSYVATVRALTNAVEARDAYTGKHAERVAAYGLELARRVDPELTDDPQIEFGFLLHDIGKVAIPDGDPAQARAARRGGEPADAQPPGDRLGDPRAGRRSSTAPRQIVRAHHERWDGGGYPDGLAGRADPARRARLRGGRRPRRDHHRPAVPARRRRSAEARATIARRRRAPSSTRAWWRRSARSPTQTSSASRPRSDRPRAMRSVLIVDDDPFIRKLVATTLGDVGDYKLVEASDGEEAVDVARRRAAARSCSSTSTCPAWTGIEACRRLRARAETAGTHDRDAHRGRGPRGGAGGRGGRRRPVPDQAVQPARAPAPGRRPGRLRLTGYLGLGSNEGDRLANLRAARATCCRSGASGGRRLVASTRRRPRVRCPTRPDFLNACLRWRPSSSRRSCSTPARRVERELGRGPGGPRHGPRPIDVDVLLLGGVEHASRAAHAAPPRGDRRAASSSSRSWSSIPSSSCPTARRC